jgi:hypothetical protein
VRARAGLLVCSFLLASPVFALAQTPPVKFTPQQVDHVLVLDRLNSRDEDTRRLAAVAYTVHNGQMLLTGQANRDRLLESVTPSGI